MFVGEDELAFLRKWQDETDITAIAPVVLQLPVAHADPGRPADLGGEEVPKRVGAAAGPITEEDLDDYLERNADMPPLHYAKFGGEDLPGYPEAWQDR